jgi:hypothetical protein
LEITSDVLLGQNSAKPWHLIGRVVSESGKPLSDVSVGPGALTDATGNYVLDLPPLGLNGYRLRFSKSGFRPITIAADPQTHRLDIVLRPGENAWIPSKCSSLSARSKELGFLIKIGVPDNLTVKEINDDDRIIYEMFYGSEENVPRMIFASGGVTGLPWPRRDQLQSSSFINERTLACGFGMDYLGEDQDGLKWRVTGIFNEIIRYERVSEKEAALFDRVIDSLCCNVPSQ